MKEYFFVVERLPITYKLVKHMEEKLIILNSRYRLKNVLDAGNYSMRCTQVLEAQTGIDQKQKRCLSYKISFTLLVHTPHRHATITRYDTSS